jgi:tetratricopeptide (TPR) repeat protein
MALQAFGEAVASKDAVVIERAAQALEKVVGADAGDVQSRFQLGVLRVLQARYEDAFRHFTLVARALPREPVVRANLAAVSVALGRFEAAIVWSDEALALAPSAKVWTMRGDALSALRRYEEAVASYRRALALDPRFEEALGNVGVALRELRRFPEALEALDQALGLSPRDAELLCNRGAVLLDLERPGEALPSLNTALALAPDHVMALNNRALALKQLGWKEEALSACEQALAADPTQAAVWLTQGGALAELGRVEDALASYDKGLALAPENALGLADKALLLSEIGRTGEAVGMLREAIARDPTRIRLFYNLTQIEKLSLDDPAFVARGRESPVLASDRVLRHYALAKVFEDHGEWEEAFRHVQAGSGLKRGLLAYDEAAALGELARTRQLYDEHFLSRLGGGGDDSIAPIFIVGMPRSGSTLIEQILASHDGICGLGETDALGRAVSEVEAGRPDLVGRRSRSDLQKIGAAYAKYIRRSAPNGARVVDKMLDNFRHLGLIVLALPRARIIHIRRNPVETCLSCYSKLFNAGVAYSYDLGELGRYYRAHERLMEHWRAALPAEYLLSVDYEAVVADLEGESRRIAAFCGMEWDPRCLEFHKTERRVRTASKMQVRQPLFDASRRREAALAPHIAPLLAALRGA